MSAPRARTLLPFVAIFGLSGSLLAACSGILGLDELPLRPETDAAPTPTDAATTPPPIDANPPADAAPDVDAAPPPCDPTRLDDDANNCGECGKVCRSKCTARVCDADRVAVAGGDPAGLFVTGGRAYFGVSEATGARILSCPAEGACSATTTLRTRANASFLRLLGARTEASTTTLTFWEFDPNAEKNEFVACETTACSTAAPFRAEPGTSRAVDAIDIDIPGQGHRVVFTTAITGVVSPTTGASRTVSALRDAQLLGHNEKYLWGRNAASFFRVTLDDPLYPSTTVALSGYPTDTRQFLWNGGASTVVVAPGSLHVCDGSVADCATRTPCTATSALPDFAFDADSVAYGSSGGLVVAPFATPCAAKPTAPVATPASPAYGQSIAVTATHVYWLELVNKSTHLYRAPR